MRKEQVKRFAPSVHEKPFWSFSLGSASCMYSKYLLLIECLEYKRRVLAGIPYISCIRSSLQMDFTGMGTEVQYA